jgi:hypothetical protein
VQVKRLRRNAARCQEHANSGDSPSGDWPAHRFPVLG